MTLLTEADWKKTSTRLLRVEMQRRGVSFVELSHRLKPLGVNIAPKLISNKVRLGAFQMAFFLQCMQALEVDFVRLSDGAPPPPEKPKKDIKVIEARIRAALQ
jgi:hypothetical protein